MKCDNCGRKIEDGEEVCQGCGAPVVEAPSEEDASPKRKRSNTHTK